MANPQPTGIMMPHTPTPLNNSQNAPAIKPCIKQKAMNKLIHHCLGVVWIGFRTTPAILSVTVV